MEQDHNSTFFNCKDLKSAVLMPGVIGLGKQSIVACPFLTYIRIPATVRSFGLCAIQHVGYQVGADGKVLRDKNNKILMNDVFLVTDNGDTERIRNLFNSGRHRLSKNIHIMDESEYKRTQKENP